MNKNAEEVNQTVQVAPVPATPAPAKVETPQNENKPAESPVENKQTAAFIKMRQEARELKRQLAEAKANNVPPPTPAPVPEQAQVTTPQIPQAPAPVSAVNDVDAEIEKQALKELSEDKDLAKIPMSVVDVLEMVDRDPRLSKLYKIDPKLAIREAKGDYLSKAGIGASPTTPKSAPISGGISTGGSRDLEALVSAAEKAKPGSKEFYDLTRQVNAELRKLHKM